MTGQTDRDGDRFAVYAIEGERPPARRPRLRPPGQVGGIEGHDADVVRGRRRRGGHPDFERHLPDGVWTEVGSFGLNAYPSGRAERSGRDEISVAVAGGLD